MPTFNTPMVFITDRTQEDVDRVKYLAEKLLSGTETEEELREFLTSLKGALNYSDIHRIASNINRIATLINIPHNLYVYDDDERELDSLPIPRVAYFRELLDHVSRIRNSHYYLSTTPRTPSMPLNTFQKINDIEKILEDALEAFMRNQESLFFCGDNIYSGEYMLL